MSTRDPSPLPVSCTGQRGFVFAGPLSAVPAGTIAHSASGQRSDAEHSHEHLDERTPCMRATRLLCLIAVTGLISVGLAAPASAAAVTTRTTLATVHPVAGTAITLTASVSPKPSGGTVAFTAGGKSLCARGTLRTSTGKATCRTTFATSGARTVVAAYSGVASTWQASSGRARLTVASGAGTVVGSLGSCTTTKGALVAVGFTTWQGPIVRGCDPSPTTGIKLLTTAGFTTTGTQHDGPAFICRIGHPLFDSGTQYPTSATESCVRTPPASAYWSYWVSPKGSNTWTYSSLGAYSNVPKNGEVQAWTYGGTDVAGTNGQPSFTPNQIRAGLPTGTAAAQVQRRAAVAAAPEHADLASATDYVTGQLVDGHYYDPFNIQFADFGLTMDGALALAGTGTADTALRKVVEFLDNRGKDASNRSVDDYTGIGTQYASGGSIAKEALVAEATGYDPREFGGHDLVKALADLVCTTKSASCAGAGNYSYAQSTFSQALGVIAQLRAGDADNAAKPVAFLESLQHPSGAFPSVIPGGDSETDSTGMAAMALALVPGKTARAALSKALVWLAGQQTSDGGFPGAAGNSVNSAALAIQALRLDAGTYTAEIDSAQRFLAAEQNTDGGFNVAVGAEANGSDIRASTQATGALVGTPFGSVLDDLKAKATVADSADYLVDQLTGGDHYVSSYQDQDGNTVTFDDQGLTADGVFSLLAAGGHASTVAAMVSYLKAQVGNYADPDGAFGGPYSGSLAKLALIAESTGGDPHAFGGTDLLTLLTDKVCSAATTDGTCTATGDFVSSFSTTSQALGVLALQASPVAADHLTATSPEVVRLHELQCADGGFSSSLITSGQACSSEVDTTGYAVQALATVPGTDDWLGAAQGYLEKAQLTNGLYHGAAGDNSNSTALAAQALPTLVDALTAPTANPPNPQTITPVVAWQSALRGLRGLAVPSGGFGLTGNATADLRASTQAVAAAAQRSLLALSGATILSLPRAVDTEPGGGTSTSPGTGSSSSGSGSSAVPTSVPSSAGSDSAAAPAGSGSPVAGGSTADTGAPAAQLLAYALLLLLVGGAVLFAGRRRVAVVIGRHRGAHR